MQQQVSDVVLYPSRSKMALLALGSLLRPRPPLIIDGHGITDNVAATGVSFVVVILHDPEAILARQPPFKRSILRANMGLVGSPVAIPGSLPISLDEVLAIIEARLARQ